METESLFEIHVSVNIKDLLKFRLWCLDNDVKAIGIIGDLPETTFSKYTNGTRAKAHDKALSMARNLALSDINVTRVRVEQVFFGANSELDNMVEGYYEFHLKYHIINSKDYQQMIIIAKDFTDAHSNGVHAFMGFNSFKKNVEPIITLRVPAKLHKSNKAIELKNNLIDYMKNNGFRTNEELHMEYVFIDMEYSKL